MKNTHLRQSGIVIVVVISKRKKKNCQFFYLDICCRKKILFYRMFCFLLFCLSENDSGLRFHCHDKLKLESTRIKVFNNKTFFFAIKSIQNAVYHFINIQWSIIFNDDFTTRDKPLKTNQFLRNQNVLNFKNYFFFHFSS